MTGMDRRTWVLGKAYLPSLRDKVLRDEGK